MPRQDRVTELLHAWIAGDAQALEDLIPVVHAELSRLARRKMAYERPGQTLQPTALVNEAYLRLMDVKRLHWHDRAHFFALSAQLMRRILVDAARTRAAAKRGGGAVRVEHISGVDMDQIATADSNASSLCALDDALESLTRIDPRRAQVIELRFFGGLSVEETAEVLQISPQTVMRDWRLARAWLARELRGDEAPQA